MKKKRCYHHYRRPRTTQERRANQERDYVRGKRLPKGLPNSWDDYHSCYQKTWKVKRKTQYRPHGRGQEHDVTIKRNSPYGLTWNLQDYFDNHNIPCRIENLYETELVTHYYRQEYRLVGHTPRLLRTGNPPKTFRDRIDCCQRRLVWIPIYKWVTVFLEKPEQRRYSKWVGVKVTWWANKDIGIDFVLKSLGVKKHEINWD
jgi:adenine specific DNA methylase Mod